MLADSSSLLQSPLRQKHGLCGETQDAKELLEHTAAIEADDLSEVMSLFEKNNEIIIHSAVDPTEWSQHWKSEREATSSSMSGIHFGHCNV